MRTRKNFTLIIISGIILALVFFTIWLFWDLPSIKRLPENLSSPSIRFIDRNGWTLYEVIDPQTGRHTPVPLSTIPEMLKKATIATEDRTFYSNPGIDLGGIIRALWINLKGGETLAGGSTITQQVARNLLLSEDEQFERTLRRKLRETWLAWRLTQKFSKDEILGLYLNQIYYGALAYGVEAAAQTYFGKSVTQLDLAECALITGLPQGPAIYNPLVFPDAAKNRQKIVLELMLNQGLISHDEYEITKQQPLIYTPKPYPIEAPHFVMMVISQLDAVLPPGNRPKDQSLIVQTTLDLDNQRLAETAISQHLQTLHQTSTRLSTGGIESGHAVPGGHNVNNAALIAIDPQTGAILSFVGNHNYFDEDHNGAINMAISPRQPGSALKPLVYAAAFNPTRTNPLTAASMILDISTTFTTHEGDAYTPANYDNLEHGPVSARQALASSLNIPAVITLDSIGIADLFDLARKVGISSLGDPDSYDLSLALGGGETSLLELTVAYGAFATTGFQLHPYAIQQISTIQGDIVYQHKKEANIRVLDERIAWLISNILNDNEARTIGFGKNSALKIDRPAAVKTGTTTNYHDNWTIGYTPDLLVGVWVGNANHEPMRGVSGLSGAGPIWHQYMRAALLGTQEKWFSIPQGMVSLEICAISGLLPTQDCPFVKSEWFISGTEPKLTDTIFHKVWIDTRSGNLADANTPANYRKLLTVMDLPPQANPWARERGIILLGDLDPTFASSQMENELNLLKILSPGDHTLFWIYKDFDLNSQRLHFEVTSDVWMKRVELWLDQKLLISFSESPYEYWWPLQAGEHTLLAKGTTQDGQTILSAVKTFSVESGTQP